MSKPADPKAEILLRNLKKFREEAGLTQEEAATLSAVPIDKLRRWERGETAKIGVQELKSLGEIYGRLVDDFLLDEPPPPKLEERPPVLFRMMPGVETDADFQRKVHATIEKLNREWREIREKKGKRR